MTLACPFCRIALAPPETVCPRDGHAAEAVDWVGVPAALSKRFRVLEPFAHGGTGSLYLADESESGRRGLLKILSSVAKHREPERARLRRELSKQITLGGGRLAVPWASGETEAVTWLFRPWLDGVSLRVRLSQASAMGVNEALAIASQLTVGLDELHRAGLLHRDIKPGHVFLQTNGQGPAKALLIDPGLCGALVRPGNSTILGTPGYVAPEQLHGKLVSFRSDLYSLGCVMYEILAGRPPFGGETEQAVLTAQLAGEPPPLPADLPEGIVAVLRSLLSKEPQARPFSAQKLRRILEPYAPDGTPMTRPPTTTFATLPDPEKPAAKPAPGPSLPPPPPSEALRASKAPSEAPRPSKAPNDAPRPSKAPSEMLGASNPSKAPPAPAEALRASRMMPAAPRPIGRPTTRGLAPPPPPRASAEELQQIDLESFELIVDQDEKTADSTQELSPAHLFDVHVQRESEAAAAKAVRDDLTVPVRLDQILAIAPARLRASAAPPVPREPVHNEPAAPPVAEQQTMFVEDEHETLPFPGHDGAHGLPAPSSALFGAMPAERATFSAESPSSDDDDDAEKTTVAHKTSSPYGSERPTPFAHIVANDDDPTTAHAAPSGLAPHTIDDNNEEAELASRHLQDTLLPYSLDGLRRKLMLGVAAAALLGLGIVTVKALIGGGEEKIAAREVVPQPPSPPAAVVAKATEPTVEPTPSVTALAAAPKGDTAKPTAAEPTAEAAPSAATGEAPGGATLTPLPVVEAMPDKKEPVVEAKPDTKEEEEVSANAEPAKSSASNARSSQDDKRKQRREEKARVAAEKEAKAAAAKSAKAAEKQAKQAKKASGANNERTAKWSAAVEEAREHYAAKRYKQAAQAYEKATQLDPTSDRTFSGLGTARFKAGDYKGAAAAYLRAVQLSPSNSVYHTSLARTYQQLGDLTKAKASYKRAVSLDPKNEGAKKSLKELGG